VYLDALVVWFSQSPLIDPVMSTDDLYRQLSRHLKAESIPNIIKTTNAILALNSNDRDALHVQAVALIQDNQYESVSRLLSDPRYSSIVASDPALAYAYGYALYKQKKLDECSTQTASLDQSTAVHHLQAQTLYRNGQFKQAAEVYLKSFSEKQVRRRRTSIIPQHTDSTETIG
jgi:hypothetical protein